MPKTSNIIYADFFKGNGESKYDQNGFDSIVACDVNSEKGTVRSSLAMVAEIDSNAPNELCNVAVEVPSGDTYWFSSASGNIWKRTSGGVWNLARTNANGACKGAGYFNGKLYYASDTKLGTYDLNTTWNDSWQTLNSGDHFMWEKKLTLKIANGSWLASVDTAGTFAANNLDLQPQHAISCIGDWLTDILLGTRVSNYVNESGLFGWDGFSTSWGPIEDYVEEVGVNTFIKAKNYLFAQVGLIGNIYNFTGARLEEFKRLRDGENAITSPVSPYQVANINGLPLIATARGIFSIGKKPYFPLAIEYVPSQGQGITPGALISTGGQVLLSWSNGVTAGVDKLSTNRANGKMTTPVALGKFRDVYVHFDLLPSSTSIGVEVKEDNADWKNIQTIADTTDDDLVKLSTVVNNKRKLQVRVTLNSNGADTPIISAIELVR